MENGSVKFCINKKRGKRREAGAATKRPKVQKGQVTKMLDIYIYEERPRPLDWRLQDPVRRRG